MTRRNGEAIQLSDRPPLYQEHSTAIARHKNYIARYIKQAKATAERQSERQGHSTENLPGSAVPMMGWSRRRREEIYNRMWLPLGVSGDHAEYGSGFVRTADINLATHKINGVYATGYDLRGGTFLPVTNTALPRGPLDFRAAILNIAETVRLKEAGIPTNDKVLFSAGGSAVYFGSSAFVHREGEEGNERMYIHLLDDPSNPLIADYHELLLAMSQSEYGQLETLNIDLQEYVVNGQRVTMSTFEAPWEVMFEQNATYMGRPKIRKYNLNLLLDKNPKTGEVFVLQTGSNQPLPEPIDNTRAAAILTSYELNQEIRNNDGSAIYLPPVRDGIRGSMEAFLLENQLDNVLSLDPQTLAYINNENEGIFRHEVGSKVTGPKGFVRAGEARITQALEAIQSGNPPTMEKLLQDLQFAQMMLQTGLSHLDEAGRSVTAIAEQQVDHGKLKKLEIISVDQVLTDIVEGLRRQYAKQAIPLNAQLQVEPGLDRFISWKLGLQRAFEIFFSNAHLYNLDSALGHVPITINFSKGQVIGEDGEPISTVKLMYSTYGKISQQVINETVPKLNKPDIDVVESARGGTGTSLLRTLRTMEAIGRRSPATESSRRFARVSAAIDQEINGETYGTFTTTVDFPALGHFLP